MRVMIVEDEPLIALDLQTILEDAGYRVVGVAASLRESLEVAEKSGPIDAAVMDVDLSGGASGLETARRLREGYDVRSLFVSARLDDEIRARASEWDPVGFIAKPFIERQILEAMASLPIGTRP